MSPKVENHIASNHMANRSVTVEHDARACVNCIWYEQYFRHNRGNVVGWIPTSTGYCLRNEQKRGALRKPCKDFETQQSNPI